MGDAVQPWNYDSTVSRRATQFTDDRTATAMIRLAPLLTPRGRLLLAQADEAPELSADLSHRLEESFARGPGHGLLQLGAAEVGTSLPPVLGYWRDLGARYMTCVVTQPEVDGGMLTPIPPPSLPEL